jgi:hypothetical protein
MLIPPSVGWDLDPSPYGVGKSSPRISNIHQKPWFFLGDLHIFGTIEWGVNKHSKQIAKAHLVMMLVHASMLGIPWHKGRLVWLRVKILLSCRPQNSSYGFPKIGGFYFNAPFTFSFWRQTAAQYSNAAVYPRMEQLSRAQSPKCHPFMCGGWASGPGRWPANKICILWYIHGNVSKEGCPKLSILQLKEKGLRHSPAVGTHIPIYT